MLQETLRKNSNVTSTTGLTVSITAQVAPKNRIAFKRVALFLESDRAKAAEMFKMVKDCYGLRSKLVHGFRVANIDDEKFMMFSMNSETLLRRSLLTILDTAITIQNFDGATREAYLEGLVFK